MNMLELWFLKRLLRKQATQGYDHGSRFSRLFALIREAYVNEFPEDNLATADANLREWFESTQHEPAVTAS